MKKFLPLLSLALCATGFSARADHSIYIVDQSGWEAAALYAWGDAEVFEGWPGTTDYTKTTYNGIEYLKFTITGYEGISINPIFNNNDNGKQIDLPKITLDKDYYFATNGSYVVTVDPENPLIEYPNPATLYVLDETGWSKTCVYGWATGQSEVFGYFPGAELTETETIEGVTYKKTSFPGNGISYNLIFSDDGSDTDRVEGFSATCGTDTYIKLTTSGASVLPTPGVEYHYIYIEDKSGWTDLYIYAYFNDAPSLFGKWPGTKATETETIEGVTYFKFAVPATNDAQLFIIHNNNGTQFDVEGTYVIDRNYTFTVTSAGVSGIESIAADNSDLPVEYFNLQGNRVDNPAKGLYIRRQGSKSEKVLVK